jgi:hypothetical protein
MLIFRQRPSLPVSLATPYDQCYILNKAAGLSISVNAANSLAENEVRDQHGDRARNLHVFRHHMVPMPMPMPIRFLAHTLAAGKAEASFAPCNVVQEPHHPCA